MASKHKLGDVATKLLFENDMVKIWELSLAPGESSSWHHHTMDYITVGLTESHMKREMEDGSGDETHPVPGQWRYAEKHQPHRVTNVGNSQHRNILIELKES
jgi:quercetin dioxygenase-like cupin family protein